MVEDELSAKSRVKSQKGESLFAGVETNFYKWLMEWNVSQVEIVGILDASHSLEKTTRQDRKDSNLFSSQKCAQNMYRLKLLKA